MLASSVAKSRTDTSHSRSVCMKQLANMELQRALPHKHTVCLRHVDSRCVKDSAGLFFFVFFYCSLGIVTAMCSPSSHLLGVFNCDARGFLDPFLACPPRPQPNIAAACDVSRRPRVPFSCRRPCRNFGAKIPSSHVIRKTTWSKITAVFRTTKL